MTVERIYRDDDGQWFFHARGDDSRGPYDSRDDAEIALGRFVARRCPSQTDRVFHNAWLSLKGLVTRSTATP